jgi:hypothetical protein
MDQKSSGIVSLVLMGAGLVAGWWYARGVQALQRNRYVSREDCEGDYGPGACSFDDGAWFGPWYLQDVRMRTRDPGNPGPGRYLEAHMAGRVADNGSRGPIGIAKGYRYGFGGTAHANGGRAGG